MGYCYFNRRHCVRGHAVAQLVGSFSFHVFFLSPNPIISALPQFSVPSLVGTFFFVISVHHLIRAQSGSSFSCLFFLNSFIISTSFLLTLTALQVGRWRVRFAMVSFKFHWHNPSGRTMVFGSTEPLLEMSTRNISSGDKGDRCVGLTT
jgi:hypothetical protein